MGNQADDFIEALQGQREISITVTGRRTGREITLPVWFVLEGSILYLLPVKGARTQWVRNLLVHPSITIDCRWSRITRQARVVQEWQLVQDMANRFRTKYRPEQVARYYSVFDACVEVALQPD